MIKKAKILIMQIFIIIYIIIIKQMGNPVNIVIIFMKYIKIVVILYKRKNNLKKNKKL